MNLAPLRGKFKSDTLWSYYLGRLFRASEDPLEFGDVSKVNVTIFCKVGKSASGSRVNVGAAVGEAFLKEIMVIQRHRIVTVIVPAGVDRDHAEADVVPAGGTIR